MIFIAAIAGQSTAMHKNYLDDAQATIAVSLQEQEIIKALDLSIDECIPKNFLEHIKKEMASKNITDSPDESALKLLYILELKWNVSNLVTSHTGFSKSNSATALVMHWICSLLITSSNEEEAVERWHTLNTTKSIKNTFAEINQILSLPDQKIRALYNHAQKYLANAPQQIIPTLVQSIYGKYGHTWNDTYELNQTAHKSRTLAELQKNGITIAIPANKIAFLKKLARNSNRYPIYEAIKNEKIFTINGLKDSKGSLVPHDIFDHLWVYDTLQKNGILKKYEKFFQSVGSPAQTDLFNRESELIAAIAYDFRFIYLSKNHFTALLDYQGIQNILKNPQSENQRHAQALLNSWSDMKEITENFSRIVSGICTERMEQRRRYGFIKVLDEQLNPQYNLVVLDPEYLALIIEAFDCLLKNKPQAIKALLHSLLIFENHLHRIINSDESSASFSITLKDIENYDPSKSNVPQEIVAHLTNNVASISSRSALYKQNNGDSL